MTKLRVNAPVELATPLLERFAQLGLEIELAEASRAEAIVAANAAADQILLPMVQERDQLLAALEPWWKRMGAALLTGKRKTVELAGCIIGTKAATASLSFGPGDEKAALASLQAAKWAKPYVRTTPSIDKAAVKKALPGKHGEQLKALGFSLPDVGDVFVLERATQAGTVSAS